MRRERIMGQLSAEKQLAIISALLKRVIVSRFNGALHLTKSEMGCGKNSSLEIDSDGDGGLIMSVEQGETITRKSVRPMRRKWREAGVAIIAQAFILAEELEVACMELATLFRF